MLQSAEAEPSRSPDTPLCTASPDSALLHSPSLASSSSLRSASLPSEPESSVTPRTHGTSSTGSESKALPGPRLPPTPTEVATSKLALSPSREEDS